MSIKSGTWHYLDFFNSSFIPPQISAQSVCLTVGEEVVGGNVVDVLEYSSQDIDTILEGWRNIYKNATEVGLEALKDFLYENPKYLTLFSDSLNVRSLEEDEFFVAHTRAIMRGINMAINGLTGAYEEEIEVLPVISHTHQKRGITADMMIQLKISLLTIFNKFLKSNKTESAAWERILDFIFNNYIIKYIPQVNEEQIIPPASPAASKISSETN